MKKKPDPQLIEQALAPELFERLVKHFRGREAQFDYDAEKGRYFVSDKQEVILKEYAKHLTALARKVFGSETLLPTYSLFACYAGDVANLPKHIDDNACTYLLDLCLYQKTPWDIWVENATYTLRPNSALAFYSSVQEHWREEFPDKETNQVAMCFFNFAEPDHWFFTKGPEYIRFIRLKKQYQRLMRELKKKN